MPHRSDDDDAPAVEGGEGDSVVVVVVAPQRRDADAAVNGLEIARHHHCPRGRRRFGNSDLFFWSRLTDY